MVSTYNNGEESSNSNQQLLDSFRAIMEESLGTKFYTRCLVQGKVCSLMIDKRSCNNVASEYMVKKLGLKVKQHPWLDEDYKLRVSRQVMISIAIGKYEDEVLCDVLPMESCHILLGKPWQNKHQAIQDVLKNRYSFKYKGGKIRLISLTPNEIRQDQLILKQRVKQAVSESLNPPHQKEKVLMTDSKETPTSLINIAPELPSPSESSSLLQDSKDTIDDPRDLPPIHEEEPQEESPADTQRSLPLVINLEQPIQLVQEPSRMPLACDYPRKHCKEIDLDRIEPYMFILVSTQEEKRFGLESVKEFCVSKSVFDQMIINFETIRFEKFLKPEGFLFDEIREFESSLRVSLTNDAFELSRTEIESALVKTFPNLNPILENVSCGSNSVSELCKPTLRDHDIDNSLSKFTKIITFSSIMHLFFVMSDQKETGSMEKHKYLEAGDTLNILAIKGKPPDVQQLQSIGRESKQGTMSEIKDVTKENAVLIQNQGELMCHIQLKENSPYILHQQKTYHSGVWNWKYLRKTTSITQGCPKLKLCFDNNSMTICLIFLFVPKLFPFDVGDLVFLQFEATNQEHGNVKAFSSMLKDEPPDAIDKEKLSHNRFKSKGYQKENLIIQEHMLPPFVLPLCKIIPREDEQVINNNLIQEEPPDPTPLSLMTTSSELIKNRIQISNSFPLFVSHVLGTVLMSSLHSENIEKELGSLRENVVNQTVTCLSVYSDSMTVIMHFSFAKGVDVISGAKEEPLDLEVLSSNFFVRTGIGVTMVQTKKTLAHFRMIFEVGEEELIQLTKKRPPTERKLKLMPKIDGPFNLTKPINKEAYELKLQGKYNENSSFNATDLVSFCADESDLRTNPFQVGEDDMIMASKGTKETKEHKEQLEPELNGVKHGAMEQLVAVETKEEEEALHLILGPTTRTKARQLNQAFHTLSHHIQGQLECANLATLVMIQSHLSIHQERCVDLYSFSLLLVLSHWVFQERFLMRQAHTLFTPAS